MGLYEKDLATTLNTLRYHIFCSKQGSSDALPPTYDAIYQHLLRANYQTFIWRRCLINKPLIPQPTDNGWHKKDHQLLPRLTTIPAAPDTLLELIICGCKKGCKRNWKCAKEELAYTEACHCGEGDDCEDPSTFKSEEATLESYTDTSTEIEE